MSQKDRQRYHLLQMVIEGKTILKEASRLMGVSYRHSKRLKKRLISEGAKPRRKSRARAASEEQWIYMASAD